MWDQVLISHLFEGCNCRIRFEKYVFTYKETSINIWIINNNLCQATLQPRYHAPTVGAPKPLLPGQLWTNNQLQVQVCHMQVGVLEATQGFRGNKVHTTHCVSKRWDCGETKQYKRIHGFIFVSMLVFFQPAGFDLAAAISVTIRRLVC